MKEQAAVSQALNLPRLFPEKSCLMSVSLLGQLDPVGPCGGDLVGRSCRTPQISAALRNATTLRARLPRGLSARHNRLRSAPYLVLPELRWLGRTALRRLFRPALRCRCGDRPRENVFARNFQEARQLSERRAFMVISVTKPQVNRVTLVIQVWVLGSRSFDKLYDALHFFFILCYKPLEALSLVNKTRVCFPVHEIYHFRQDQVSRRKQFSVISCAPLVPIPKCLPFVSVFPGSENIALSREDKIWTDREREIGKPGFQQINGTTRVNRPDRAGIL